MLVPRIGEVQVFANGRAQYELTRIIITVENDIMFTAELHLKHVTTGRMYYHSSPFMRRIVHPKGERIKYKDFIEYYYPDLTYAIACF